MKGEFQGYEKQLSRLIDALVNDILSTSDEDTLAEAKEAYGDAEKAVGHFDALIAGVNRRIGKSKLAAARAAVDEARPTSSPTFTLSIEEKRRILQGFATPDNRLGLTLAARKGTEITERDLDTILRALYELGAIDENGVRR